MEVCRCLIKQNYDKWQNCVGVWVKGTEGKERFLWKLRQPPLDVKFYNLMMRLQPNHKALFQKGFLFSDNYIIAAHEGSFVCVTKAAWHVPLSCLLVINFVLLTLRKTAFLWNNFKSISNHQQLTFSCSLRLNARISSFAVSSWCEISKCARRSANSSDWIAKLK